MSTSIPTAGTDRAHPDRPPRAVAFGEALVVLVQTEPGPLEDAESFRRSLGGAETNVAIGLVAHGLPTTLLSRVGDDGFGRYVRAELERFGVDASMIEVDPVRSTGVYVKEVGGATGSPTDLGPGRSAMHYYRAGSAGSHLSPALLDTPRVAAILDAATLVHTTGITPALSSHAAAAQRLLVDRARPRSLVAFDLNWRPALWHGRIEHGRELLAGFLQTSDIALTGLDEASAVFGTRTADDIRRRFPEPRWLIVKNDGGAVSAYDGDERVDVDAHEVAVVEAIGAGDAFAAGLLAGLARGDALRDCVEHGHATAARALRTSSDHVAGGVR